MPDDEMFQAFLRSILHDIGENRESIERDVEAAKSIGDQHWQFDGSRMRMIAPERYMRGVTNARTLIVARVAEKHRLFDDCTAAERQQYIGAFKRLLHETSLAYFNRHKRKARRLLGGTQESDFLQREDEAKWRQFEDHELTSLEAEIKVELNMPTNGPNTTIR